jgi:hypothetical protein
MRGCKTNCNQSSNELGSFTAANSKDLEKQFISIISIFQIAESKDVFNLTEPQLKKCLGWVDYSERVYF